MEYTRLMLEGRQGLCIISECRNTMDPPEISSQDKEEQFTNKFNRVEKQIKLFSPWTPIAE